MSIQIVPYNPLWPEEFKKIGRQIRNAVGDEALAIHHIGSTSVSGLAAKDVIDIQMTVAEINRTIKPLLEGIGFILAEHIASDHRPPDRDDLTDDELAKRLYNYNSRKVNLHVRVAGKFNQRYPLLCRDYLRAHPMAANAYVEIKRQLASYFPDDASVYYAIKDPVFDVIMAGAEEWAIYRGWQSPASDA